MSCGCGGERQKFNRCGATWAPNKYDYQVSDPSVRVYNDDCHRQVHRPAHRAEPHTRAYVVHSNRHNHGDCHRSRRELYFGFRDPLYGRVNAGGYDQAGYWNDDGDQ